MGAVPPEAASDIAALLGRERGSLMATLGRLQPRDWDRSTPCPGWRVRDLVSHIWGTDLHVLSRLRDGHDAAADGAVGAATGRAAVVAAVDEHNARWVAATRGLSPQVLVERLRESGPQVSTVFRLADPRAPGERVSWASAEVAPMWFCGLRELTERFVHQQQLRAATGRDPLDDDELVAAVVDTFAYAFPAALAEVRADPGTHVEVAIGGGLHPAIRRHWSFLRSGDGSWERRDGSLGTPVATLATDADGFWRLLSGGLSSRDLVRRVELTGTPTLFAALRDTRAVLV